jgi:leucine-rich repeat/coiled-coil domain-containing protein 1
MTVSMTARMAEGVADANAAVEGLRSRLAAAEAAEADARRAEGGTRAENVALAESLTAARKLHASELERRASSVAEEWGAKLAREVASCEERARAGAAAAAEKERGALQEQVTFLKVQLQYALKEADKEAASLSDALSSARAEAGDLQRTLAASSTKHSEHEALVADLTHVLNQQKALIQRLERDKAALAGRLRDAQPERVDALLSEISSLRRANAELDVLREQVAHTQRAWHECERRAVEASSSAAASLQDAAGRADRAEAAADAAREEARVSRRDAERAEKKLGSAEDADKVKNAMLDSANDTIEQLKADSAELQGEVEDARRAADDAEASLRSGGEADARDKANLRREIDAGEAALEVVGEKLAAAGAKAAEAESKLARAHETLSEKEKMLGYVNEEVDRVKGMFEAREARLRDERDAARRDARDARDAAEAADMRTRSLEAQLSEAAAGLQAAVSDASTARAAAEGAGADAASARAKVAEAEEEMRALLGAVERQKTSSASKMKQLATILQDL